MFLWPRSCSIERTPRRKLFEVLHILARPAAAPRGWWQFPNNPMTTRICVLPTLVPRARSLDLLWRF